MSLKEIEDKKNDLDLLEKDELISMIHELLIIIKKNKNKSVVDKTNVRFLERQLTKIRDQIDKTLKTKLDDTALWKPTETYNSNLDQN